LLGTKLKTFILNNILLLNDVHENKN